MAEAEQPERLRPQHQVTVDDVRQLMGASTPHFALQLRNRIRKLIARPARRTIRPAGSASRRSPGSSGSAFTGEMRGEGFQDGERPLPSSTDEHRRSRADDRLRCAARRRSVDGCWVAARGGRRCRGSRSAASAATAADVRRLTRWGGWPARRRSTAGEALAARRPRRDGGSTRPHPPPHPAAVRRSSRRAPARADAPPRDRRAARARAPPRRARRRGARRTRAAGRRGPRRRASARAGSARTTLTGGLGVRASRRPDAREGDQEERARRRGGIAAHMLARGARTAGAPD